MIVLDGDLVFVLEKEEKKGPGRGWWGPPSGTHGKVKDVEIKYEEGLDAENVKEKTGLAPEDYREMFHLSGYTTEIKQITRVDGSLKTDIYWKDAEGEDVGFAIRILDGKVAKNDVLGLGEKNKGLGRALYKQQIDVLTRAGYEEIQLYADITIGRYAWAKMGFNYADPGETASTSGRFQKWADKRDIKPPKGGWPKFKSAYDVATYKIPGVSMVGKDIANRDVPLSMKMDIGKAFMLDKEPDGHGAWGGVLKLGS